MEELLNEYQVVVERQIEWGDMDAFQHVNNVVYFRFFESARVAYGEKIGVADRMETKSLGPILKWIECKFVKPLVFPDTVLIGVRTLSVEGSEMKMGYTVVSRAQGAVAAVGTSIGVFYDYRNGRRVDFPRELIDRIVKLEGKPVPRRHDPEYRL